MKIRIVIAATAMFFLTGHPLFADKITDAIHQIEEAYKDKDYKGALDELEYLKADLQKLKRAEDLTLLPEPLEGWQRHLSEDESAGLAALLGGGSAPTTIGAEYTKGSDTVTIEIMANSPMISIMSMMIGNPAMMSSKPGTEPYRYKRNKGMKKVENGTVEITLLIAGQIILTVKGNSESAVETYLKRVDISRLKSALL